MPNPNRVNNLLKYGRTALYNAGIESGGIDALVLLSSASGMTKETIFAHGDWVLSEAQAEKYSRLIIKRMDGCPVQYIINKAEFMGIEFYVDENVLIPRADTEILAELAIKEARGLPHPAILDLCTGSGCIAVSLARYIENAVVTGGDISEAAANIAEKNARAAGVNAVFLVSDLFDGIRDSYDIIVCNPPYIPDSDIRGLMRQVRDFEPRIALSGGKNGLDFYEKIAEKAQKHLRLGGKLMFETGYDQAEAVAGILSKNYKDIKLYKDLAGFNRVVSSIYGGIECLTN